MGFLGGGGIYPAIDDLACVGGDGVKHTHKPQNFGRYYCFYDYIFYQI